jgi:nucleotide-binding universal stress UspA family protein
LTQIKCRVAKKLHAERQDASPVERYRIQRWKKEIVMSYKTILVHVDESRHLPSRVAVAAQIAIREDAHLVGAAMTGISRFIRDTAGDDASDPALAPYLGMLRQRANRALEAFDKLAAEAGVSTYEKRLIDDEAAGGISLQARFCDLVVVGQDDPDERSPAVMSGFAEYVVMSGSAPTLIVPYAGNFHTVAERVVIAWNGSAEAMHAVRGALPLLKRAKIVEVAIFNAGARPDVYGVEPGADIALYLARHGVKVDVLQEDVDGETDVGDGLLSLSVNLGSDLLVMGCFGHSRFREILLGGTTREILQSMTIPVLMAH